MRVVAGSLFMGASATASADVVDGADHRGFYLGADLGVANYPDDATVDLGDALLSTGEVNTTPFVFNLNGGYRFNRYFAWEVARIDLSKVDADLAGPDGRGTLDYRVRGPRDLGARHPAVQRAVGGVRPRRHSVQ